MVRAVDAPSKSTYALVRFTYGDPGSPSYKAFTNWSFDIPGSPTYVSEPTMEVKPPENDGIFGGKTLDISLPLSNSWFADLVSGTPQALVSVQVEEITVPDVGGDTSSRRIFFRGEMVRTIKNFQGRGNYSVAKFASIKSRLDIPMGLAANHHCVWTLFGKGCIKGKTGFSNLLTVDTIDGKVLTTTTSPARTGKFFHRGYIEYQGLRIGIKDWSDSALDTFYMVKAPPTSWAGKVVTCWAGCDKTITTCRARFANEINFGGLGYAIPSHNPLIENPG
jgi:hypothetical protein